MRAAPNFIIAGVNKAGTTSLFAYLSQHPDIYPSSIKETGQFLTYRYAEPPRPWEAYLAHFRGWQEEPIIMEATPGYFYGGREVAVALRELLGAIKIAILFRDPVARLVSFYKSQKALLRLPQEMTLIEYVAACDAIPVSERWRREHNTYWGVEGGYYARWLPDWHEVFGGDVRIFFFSQLRQQPRALLNELGRWLDIDGAPFEHMPLGTENRSVNYRNPALQQFALILNRQGERFWRANPRFKRQLRALYFRLNGRPFEEEMGEALLRPLHERYAGSNAALKQQLLAQGYDEFPGWLSA